MGKEERPGGKIFSLERTWDEAAGLALDVVA